MAGSSNKLSSLAAVSLIVSWSALAAAQAVAPTPTPPPAGADTRSDAPSSANSSAFSDADFDVPPPAAAVAEPPVPEPPRPAEPPAVPESKPVQIVQVAPAPAPNPEDLIVSHRELGGHHFPLPVFVPPALTFSYFGVRAGLEYTRVPGFSRDISFFGTSFSEGTLETVNAAETVDVALRLHDYVALLGSAYGLARVGANEQTLLGTGADYTYGGDVGLLVKVFRIAGFQLAVRGNVGYFAGQQAGIVELFQDIGAIVNTNISSLSQIRNINEIDVPGRLMAIENAVRAATSAILTPFRGVQYSGAVNMAQSLGSAMGLQLSLGVYGKAETYDIPVFDATTAAVTANPRDVNKFFPKLGVAFDIDFQESLGIPLDLMAEYTLTRLSVETALPEGNTTRSWTEHVVALGGYYAGALNLQLGLMAYILYGLNPDVGANALPSGDPFDVGAQFVFRYLR